ncbi:uncharacterized protein V6R79_024997 [Siganus canaliculatus]
MIQRAFIILQHKPFQSLETPAPLHVSAAENETLVSTDPFQPQSFFRKHQNPRYISVAFSLVLEAKTETSIKSREQPPLSSRLDFLESVFSVTNSILSELHVCSELRPDLQHQLTEEEKKNSGSGTTKHRSLVSLIFVDPINQPHAAPDYQSSQEVQSQKMDQIQNQSTIHRNSPVIKNYLDHYRPLIEDFTGPDLH